MTPRQGGQGHGRHPQGRPSLRETCDALKDQLKEMHKDKEALKVEIRRISDKAKEDKEAAKRRIEALIREWEEKESASSCSPAPAKPSRSLFARRPWALAPLATSRWRRRIRGSLPRPRCCVRGELHKEVPIINKVQGIRTRRPLK